MSNAATRRKRFTAGVLAGALAVSVMPLFGFTGVAGALEEPTGDGSVCEDPPAEEPFIDVQDTDPAVDEIECLVGTEITQGTTETTYSPNASVTRRQMALFLVRLAETADENEINDEVTALPAGDGQTPFTDIANESAEVKVAVDRLSEANVAQGTTATTFGPRQNVTRRQMANFLVRLQEYLAGADITPDNAPDAFDDDEGDNGEAALNTLAAEGVFEGNGQGQVNPGANITRRQMAFVIVRKLQYFFENDVINRVFPEDDTNQGFTVAGGTETRGAGGAPTAANTRTCTISGIPAGSTVDAVLLPSEDVTVVNGQTLFQDLNSNNVADEDAVGAAIVNVNGTNTAGTQRVNDINAALGAISVTIYGAAADDVTLVIHADNAGLTANALDLTVPGAANANAKAPREAFGTGCRTVFANEAANGAFTTTVASTAKDQDLFTGANTFSYFYDSNDVFQIGGVQVSLATFEAALSPSDGISGTYAADAAFPSTFNLTDSNPVAPGSAATTVSGTTVTLTFPESTTTTADSYNVYRVIRPAGGTCPDFNTTAGRTAFGAAVGTVTDPTPGTQGATNLTFVSSGLNPATNYCFAVTTVDEGDESNTGATATALTGTQADTGAPRITDVRAADAGTIGLLDAGDTHQFIFSEPMATTVDDAGQLYRVLDADGTAAEIICGTNATCALQPAGTYNGTVFTNANQVLRVTINGAVTPLTGFLGSVSGVQYPATITNVSAGWDDTTGNQLDLAGSPDKVIDVATITPTPGGTGDTTAPNIAGSVADESADTIVLTYNETVLCDASTAANFRFTDADNTAPGVAPTGIVCNGTNTVTLTFADGAIEVADGTPLVTYTDDNAAVDANDVRDVAGNQAAAPDNEAPTVQA